MAGIDWERILIIGDLVGNEDKFYIQIYEWIMDEDKISVPNLIRFHCHPVIREVNYYFFMYNVRNHLGSMHLILNFIFPISFIYH